MVIKQAEQKSVGIIREFKQIATAGADTATGSKFRDTAHVRGLHPSVARNPTT